MLNKAAYMDAMIRYNALLPIVLKETFATKNDVANIKTGVTITVGTAAPTGNNVVWLDRTEYQEETED